MIVRPLRRVCPGVWRSRDGLLTFAKHFSDPKPERWYVYETADEGVSREASGHWRDEGAWPLNEGQGHTSLRKAAAWAEKRDDAILA